MKTFIIKSFTGWHPDKEIAEFINTNNIKKEDIVTITQIGGSFTLFYYGDN
jgi:hypothetical protein